MFNFPRFRQLAAVVIIVTGTLLGPGSSSVAAADDPNGIGISVDVVSPAPTDAGPVAVVALPVGTLAAGSSFQISVTGFAPLSFVALFVQSTPQLLANGNADSAGTFAVVVTLPVNLEPGNHLFSVTGTGTDGLAVSTTVASFAITEGGLLAAATTALPPAGDGTAATAGGDSAYSAGGTGSGGATVTQMTVAPPSASASLGTETQSLGGILTVSGLSTITAPALGPGGGDATLAFTMKNVSTKTFDSSLRFWLVNGVGIEVAGTTAIKVAALGAGETRTITTTLRNIGQWAAFTAHVTLTPPKVVDSVRLVSLTRDASILLPPIFALAMLALLLAVYFAVRRIIAARWPRPKPVEA